MERIRKRFWVAGLVVLIIAMVALGLAWLTRPGPPTGPWRGQIVDAQTRQPLEGAVVLALWDKRTFAWPHPDRNYHDIDEVVSDADGRFVIPARDVSSRHPFELMIGPIVTIFKPGYGQWRFEGAPEQPSTEDAHTAKLRRNRAWKRFAEEGAVILLPRSKTKEERRDQLGYVLPGWEVPLEKIPRTRAAYDEERVALGLKPMFKDRSR